MAENIQIVGNRTLGQWVIVKQDPKALIRDRFEMSSKLMAVRHDRWGKIRNAYHGYVADVSKKKGRANFHFHKVFPQIELETARFVVNYFRHNPFIAVKPTGKGGASEQAHRHEQSIQHYLEHSPTYFLEFLRLVKYTLLYGSGFTMPTWRHDTRKVKKIIPVTIGGITIDAIEQEEEETVYDGLLFKTFSPNDVFPYPYATNIQTAPWVIVVEFVRAEVLVELAEQGIFDKGKVNQIPLNGFLQDKWEFRKQFADLGFSTPDVDPELVCLQHLFTPDRFQTLANDDQIIRDVPNFLMHGQIPLVQGVKTLDPDSFWPIGTAQNILPNQKLLSMYMNAMVDQTVSTQWPVWKYKSRINPNDLLSLPNHKIPVQNMDDVDIIKMPELKQDMLAIKTMLEANTEEVTGFFGVQKGAGSGQPQTATSDSIFQSEGNNRINYDIMSFENLTLIPMAKQISKLVFQFMPEELEVRINGPGGDQFQTVTKEGIKGEFDFKATGASESINRAVVQKQLIELFSIAQGVQQMVQMPTGEIVPVPLLNSFNALKEIYEGYNRRNTDKLLYAPEIFGEALSNDMLNPTALPGLQNQEQLIPDPATGALRTQQIRDKRKVGGSVNPAAQVTSANKVETTRV